MIELITKITDRIFEFGRPVTPGEEAVFRTFELFVAGGLCAFAWFWAFDVLGPEGAPYEEWLATAAGALDSGLVVTLNAGLITLLLALGLLRRGERFAYLAALPLLHLQFLTRYWPEEGLHHSQLVGMCLLAIGLACFLFRDASLRLRFASGMSYVLVALAYLLSALSKLRQTGWDWIDGSNLQMWISMNQVHRISKDQSFGMNGLQELIMSNTSFATLVLVSGLSIELTSFFFLFRRTRMYSATAIILMHLGITAAMGIYFSWNVSTLLLLGFPWPPLVDRLLSGSKSRRVTAQE